MCLRTHTWRSRRNLAPLLISGYFLFQCLKFFRTIHPIHPVT
nr:MAG TPA: hypothetical protein [Caudoviricetes sp.]